MALSEENELKVCKILGVRPLELDYQISLLATNFTSERQTQVEDEISTWDTIKSDFTNIHPNLKNFGAEIKFNDAKNEVRKNIAILFERPDWAGVRGGGRLQRA